MFLCVFVCLCVWVYLHTRRCIEICECNCVCANVYKYTRTCTHTCSGVIPSKRLSEHNLLNLGATCAWVYVCERERETACAHAHVRPQEKDDIESACVRVLLRVCVCTVVCAYTPVCTCVSVCVRVCVGMHVCTSVYVRMALFIYTHTIEEFQRKNIHEPFDT